MPMVIEGVLSVEEMLLNLDTQGARRVVKELYKQALKTRDLARKFAPCEYGNLEQAIKVRPDELLKVKRDALGRFARQEIEVYIDNDYPAPQRHRKSGVVTVGDYAYHIHEHLWPYGNWKLGRESRSKQDGQAELVGGGFLERAAQEIENQIEGALLDILRDL